jgi:hypothetical protein
MNIELVMSVGAFAVSSVAAAAACASAYASLRSVRRQELRDIPRAAIETVEKGVGLVPMREIVVSNIGAVAFSIIEVGVGDKSLHGSAFAAGLGLPDDSPVRTVPPGGNTRFDRPVASGRAWVRIASGEVFYEQQ